VVTCDRQLIHRRAVVIGNALSPTVDREEAMDTGSCCEKCLTLTMGLHAHIRMFLISKHSLLTVYIPKCITSYLWACTKHTAGCGLSDCQTLTRRLAHRPIAPSSFSQTAVFCDTSPWHGSSSGRE